MSDPKKIINRSRARSPLWVLLILFLLFAVPIFIAWLTSSENQPFTSHTTQHGQLISPPVLLTALNLQDKSGQPVQASAWKGRWLLLYLLPASCDASCEKSIYYLRQIRTATGKDSDRIQRAVLSLSHQPISSHLQQLLDVDFVGTLQFTISPDALAKLTQAYGAAPKDAVGNTYLVDPLGNILMVYGPATPPMGIYKDLQRLLKISHIG